MTREELRKIFDDAERAICTPENFKKVYAEITASSKFPPSDEKALAIRVNRILDREVVFEVFAKVLADKSLSGN